MEKEEWRKIDQLQHIMREGMRIKPVAAMGSARQLGKEFSFDSDDGKHSLCLPKDAFVWVNFYATFRNKKYFGDDADEFRPSRWENPTKEMQLAYTPFSLGMRNCVGQTLANAEMNTVLSVLLAQYDFRLEDEGTSDYFLTLKPKGARLIPRKLDQ